MSDSVCVLVTGAAGRIGQAACEGLVARGHRVRAFDVRETPNIEDAVVGNITNTAEVNDAMQGVDVVVHLAATADETADFMSRSTVLRM